MCEMDVYIYYWNSCNQQGKVRYRGSEFLVHARSKDITTSFNKSIESLNQSRILQIPMDRPNVNWNFYEHTVSEREDDLPSLMNIGSCILDVVNGDFKIVAESTNWKLKKVLKACFAIFHKSPARDDYTSVTGSTTFPLFFCATRYAFLIFMDDIHHMHDIV